MSADRAALDPVAALERDLLERLGLGPDASADEIDAAHASVVAYLASAPGTAQRWAREQAAAADEAYALLSDPAALQQRAAAPAPRPTREPAAAIDNEPNPDPAPKPRRKAAGTAAKAAAHTRGAAPASAARRPSKGAKAADAAVVTDASGDDLLDDLIAEVTPSAHRDEVQRARPRSPANAGSGRRLIPGRMLVVAAAVVGVAAIAFVVSGFANSGIPSAPGPVESAAAEATLDESAVTALMERIQADPNDTDALMQLGDAFFAAGQYDVSAEWLARLVALEPDNVQALVALGAAQYNAGNAADAETAWTSAVELDPENVEAHYDLGFLYLRLDPPDLEGMQREWQKVVELAPGTEVAESVQTHLSALTSTEPTESAAPSAASSAATP